MSREEEAWPTIDDRGDCAADHCERRARVVAGGAGVCSNTTVALSPVGVVIDSFTGTGPRPNTSVCAAQVGQLASNTNATCVVTW